MSFLSLICSGLHFYVFPNQSVIQQKESFQLNSIVSRMILWWTHVLSKKSIICFIIVFRFDPFYEIAQIETTPSHLSNSIQKIKQRFQTHSTNKKKSHLNKFMHFLRKNLERQSYGSALSWIHYTVDVERTKANEC